MKRLISVTTICFLALMSGTVSARHNVYSPPSTVQPHSVPMNPIYTNKYDFEELSAERVFNELVANGLAYNPVIKGKAEKENRFKFKKQIQFRYKEFKGYICEFDSENKLQEAQEDALELNEKGIKNNWSMTHKNIILVIDGELPVDEFLKFQEALRRL